MKKLILAYIDIDDWDRPVYEDRNGNLFKDVSLGYGDLDLWATYGGIDSEPDVPIRYIEKYKDMKIELINQDEDTREEKFNYLMLGRLKSDCDYYLGNGNRYAKSLWAENEMRQIEEMKRLYDNFEEDKKPEWLTWEQILEYESKMI